MKTSRKIILITMSTSLVLLFLVVTIFLLYRSFISPVSKNTDTKEVVIENGMSSIKIGKLLKENNYSKRSIIKWNRQCFKRK